jgi:hypothetical protein
MLAAVVIELTAFKLGADLRRGAQAMVLAWLRLGLALWRRNPAAQ